MSSLKNAIRKTEKKWLDPLSDHCRKLFGKTFLPSHDHLHHNRVWSYARSLLLLMEESGAKIPAELPLELLVSVYFHDTGLTRTRGEQHGLESRKLCEEFFGMRGSGSRPGIPPGKDTSRIKGVSGLKSGDSLYPGDESMEKILHAIEHHDDKSLRSNARVFNPLNPPGNGSSLPGLLSILSSSDDLDAFGKTGIYRYAEIYLLRGIPTAQLPARVTGNVKDRFENIKRSFGVLKDFIRLHETRFREVYEFYLGMGQAMAGFDEKPSWEPVLIEIFRNSLNHRINLLKSDRLLPETEFDLEIRSWFNSLDSELSTME